MTDRQAAKAVVLQYFKQFESASTDEIVGTINAFASPDYQFRGVHPFNELRGSESVAAIVWQPMWASFSSMQRRQDMFMAGPNLIDDNMWVTSMGKFMGLFDADWLGIPATQKIAQIPYCEFFRIDSGKIAESALWVDIISVMKQAGLDPFAKQTGADIINPGPKTCDGLMFSEQDDAASQKTLALIMEMCNDLVGDGMGSGDSMLRKTWHEDMHWFGPAGIGATFTLERYQQQHQGPFRAGLDDIVFNGHVLEHAEGDYGGWFGWPNLRMKHGEGYLGFPASDKPTEMRVVDIYRRDGDKLAENWIFIDFLHYFKKLGIDLLNIKSANPQPKAQ
jgi:hypothetical protein